MLVKKYAAKSVNSNLASLGSLFSFLGREDCRVKALKIQCRAYSSEDEELTATEYMHLLTAAKENRRLFLIIETICATGIRVSELQYFTFERVRDGKISVRCKSKSRTILLPEKLKKQLMNFAEQNRIEEGYIFRTRSENPINRSNIWTEMKKLCEKAEVPPKKVFPHNLRKLFARTFYTAEKDIAKLADILGHSSIDTTRIYIVTTGAEHKEKLENLGLII